jgi:hypothetical protein
MVWLEDPLTGDMPHRTGVEEEDEQQAHELVPQYSAQPEVQASWQATLLLQASPFSCTSPLWCAYNNSVA